MKHSQSLLDRANEWVNENHPELVGEAREECLRATMDDLALIDSCRDDEEDVR